MIAASLFVLLVADDPSVKSRSESATPVPLIFETDLSGDCDDVGALAMIHTLVDRGEATLLMVGINRDEPTGSSAAAVDAINTYFGRGEIPIGTSHAGRAHTPRTSSYAPAIGSSFPNDALPDAEMPDAVRLYRKTLAAAADRSIVVASVGGTTNLAELLMSSADDDSQLPGRDLVAQKVQRLVQMAGQFPSSRVRRAEANMLIDPPANRLVAEEWPTPIVWSGWEVGDTIRTGTTLATLPESHPVRRAYALHPGGGLAADGRRLSSLEGGRPSWDQTAVLFAVRGVGPSERPMWQLVSGAVVLGSEAKHTDWDADASANQSYLVPLWSDEEIASEIEALMRRPRSARSDRP